MVQSVFDMPTGIPQNVAIKQQDAQPPAVCALLEEALLLDALVPSLAIFRQLTSIIYTSVMHVYSLYILCMYDMYVHLE